MKKIVLLYLLVLMSVTSVLAKGENPVSATVDSKMRAQIVSLLNDVNFEVNEDIKAVVKFVINDEGKMVVLSVKSTDARVSSYVKSQLNYQAVSTPTNANPMEVYVLPLKVIK